MLFAPKNIHERLLTTKLDDSYSTGCNSYPNDIKLKALLK